MKTTTKLLALLLAFILLLCSAPLSFAAALPTPQNVKIYADDGYIQLNWDKPSDMDMMPVKSGQVLYSTDQSNWQVAKSISKGAALASFEAPEEGAFSSGSTYYFCVQWLDWNGNTGNRSNIVSAVYSNSELGVQADWDQITEGYDSFRVTEKGENYNKVNLKKGTKVVFDTPLYTLTVQVAEIKGVKATIKATLKDKIDGDDYFYIDYLTGNWKGANKGSYYTDPNKRTLNETVNLNQLIDGACSLTFGVKMWLVAAFNGLPTYRKYVDDYDFSHFDQKHTVYFQNAPAAGKLDNKAVSANQNSITVGKAYKTANKAAKGSGTIVFYKAAADKKWSSKTFAAGKALSLTKLKAGTVYQIKTVNFTKGVSAADGKTVVTSKSGDSNVLKVSTGTTPPEIKSVKISNVKVGKNHVNGYWESDGDWHPAYDVTLTTYTITVTLKNAPKGTRGIKVNGADRNGYATWVKGTGNTFTVKATAAGNAKGKKVNLTIQTYANNFGSDYGYSGYSAEVKKAVTL